MPSSIPQHEIEERIRQEFQAAFDELERACDKEKAGAAAHLNRAMRRLYDFVGHGEVPQDLQRKRSVERDRALDTQAAGFQSHRAAFATATGR